MTILYLSSPCAPFLPNLVAHAFFIYSGGGWDEQWALFSGATFRIVVGRSLAFLPVVRVGSLPGFHAPFLPLPGMLCCHAHLPTLTLTPPVPTSPAVPLLCLLPLFPLLPMPALPTLPSLSPSLPTYSPFFCAWPAHLPVLPPCPYSLPLLFLSLFLLYLPMSPALPTFSYLVFSSLLPSLHYSARTFVVGQ